MDKETADAHKRLDALQKELDALLVGEPEDMSNDELQYTLAELNILMAKLFEELAAAKKRHGEEEMAVKAIKVAQGYRASAERTRQGDKLRLQ